MVIDPVTLGSIAGGAGKALSGFGSAAPSAARADSYQAGVSSPFGDFIVNSTGNISGAISGGAKSFGSLPSDFSETPAFKKSAINTETLLWVALGGAVLWVALKK